jgi:hypothetical protein
MVALALPMVLALCSLAQDQSSSTSVAGNWQMSWQGRQGTQQGTLQLQQDGSKLTGTLEGPRGSAPITGNLDGNNVSFQAELKGRRGSITLAFTGTLDGDKMNGTFQPQGGHGGRGRRGQGEGGGQQSRTWSATRQSSGSGNGASSN